MDNVRMRSLIAVQIKDLEELKSRLGAAKMSPHRMDLLDAEIKGLHVRLLKYM